MAGTDWRHDTLDRIRVLIEETDGRAVAKIGAEKLIAVALASHGHRVACGYGGDDGPATREPEPAQPETAPGFDRDHAFHACLPSLLVAGCQLSVADTAR